METKKRTTYTLSHTDIINAIVDWMKNNHGVKVLNGSVKITDNTSEYDPNLTAEINVNEPI